MTTTDATMPLLLLLLLKTYVQACPPPPTDIHPGAAIVVSMVSTAACF